MLDIGIVGLGADWEHRYRPALHTLRSRIRVRSVYAATSGRAEAAAAELKCAVAPGLLALLERRDVRGILLLDQAWYARTVVQFACRRGKPVFLAGHLAERQETVQTLHRLAAECGVTVMPELGRRFTPATTRLRELMASRLGRPLRIVVQAGYPAGDTASSTETSFPAERDLLVELFDWCRSLAGTPPASIHSMMQTSTGHDDTAGGREVFIEFRQPAGGGDAPTARIQLRPLHDVARGPSSVPGDDSAPRVRCHVQCAAGVAVLESATRISWEHAGEQATESLAADRLELEMMLDLFCRRVVGGLIPVPTLEDVSAALALAAAGAESRRSGQRIALDSVP